MNKFASFAVAATASAVVVFVTMQVPGHALLYAAHRFPSWLEPRIAVATAQALMLALLFAALRLSPTRLSPGRATASGMQAVAWLVLATFLLSLLVGLTLLQGDPDRADAGAASRLVSRWAADFPVTGVAGRTLLVGLLIPILEELLFRGLVLGFLMRSTPAWAALVLATVLFALGHDSRLLAAVLGLAYGLVYLRFRSLRLCILAHAAHNGLSTAGASLLAAWLSDAGVHIDLGYWTLPVQLAWLAVVVACVGMFLRRVFGRIEGQPVLRMRQPVVPLGGATT